MNKIESIFQRLRANIGDAAIHDGIQKKGSQIGSPVACFYEGKTFATREILEYLE